MTTQLITPNPNVWCRPGYCLEYVRNTFGLPIRYGSATEAWNNAKQHPDRNFPDGMWLPIFFAIDIEPNGHIALLAPDQSVYSSSDYGNTPHHHPSIEDLINYYAVYGKMQLTYLGWAEDVAGFPVVSLDSINVDSIPATPAANPLEGFLMALSDAEQRDLYNSVVYIASAQFKADIFAGTTDLEKGARAAFHDELLDRPIDNVKTGGKTSVRIQTGWLPADFANTPGNVLNAKFPDGSNLAGIVTAIKTATSTGTTPAQVDVTALAQQLAPLLNNSTVEALVNAIRAQWNK